MAIKDDLKPSTHLKTSMSPATNNLVLNPNSEAIKSQLDLKEAWGVIRWILVAWALAVWFLLVMLPGMDKIINITTAMLHLPNIFIGLGLIAAIFASYSLRSDKQLLWFLGVLLLLAGWM
ncbi:MAG: hypothetical protein E6Q83_06960 [Thiothrix sp.]|nr:MAG: hypothetical protein E6Q83_06960 [Thiothrix sp.]